MVFLVYILIFLLSLFQKCDHHIFFSICNHRNLLNSLVLPKEGIKMCIGTETFKCCLKKFAVSCEMIFNLIFIVKYSS